MSNARRDSRSAGRLLSTFAFRLSTSVSRGRVLSERPAPARFSCALGRSPGHRFILTRYQPRRIGILRRLRAITWPPLSLTKYLPRESDQSPAIPPPDAAERPLARWPGPPG